MPTPSTTQVGHSFNITFGLLAPTTLTSSFALSGGGTIVPSLTTTGPRIGAYASATLDASFWAGAEVCGVICVGPTIGWSVPGGPVTQELLAMNMNSLTTYNPGVFRVMNVDQTSLTSSTGTSYPPPAGPLSFSAQIPTLNADSRLGGAAGGVIGDEIVANDRNNVLTLNLNVDQVVSDLIGVPLHGVSNGIGYNLLTANAGLGVDIAQTFTFDPNLSATLNFGSDVDVLNPNGTVASVTKSVTFTLGQTVRLAAPNALTLQATPTYDLHNSTTNNTSLKLTGDVNVDALGANIAGLTIGPLIQEHVAADLSNITLANSSFEVNVAPIFGDPFNMLFNPTEYVNNLPFNLCDFGGCTDTGLVGVRNWMAGGYYQDTIYQVESYTSQTPDMWATLLSRYTTSLGTVVGYSDPYLIDPLQGKVFFDNLADIQSTSGASLSVSNTTDADAAHLLASTGFVDQSPAFVIPEGDPAPVPEPSTTLLLGSGLAGIAAMRRKVRRQMTSSEGVTRKAGGGHINEESQS